MTKQGIKYLEGVYVNCVRHIKANAKQSEAGHIGAAMIELGYKQQRDLIEAIATFEHFPLPPHDDIFGKEAPHEP